MALVPGPPGSNVHPDVPSLPSRVTKAWNAVPAPSTPPSDVPATEFTYMFGYVATQLNPASDPSFKMKPPGHEFPAQRFTWPGPGSKSTRPDVTPPM